jgi:hypothetical protein
MNVPPVDRVLYPVVDEHKEAIKKAENHFILSRKEIKN